MEQAIQQLKADTADAVTFTGHSLTYWGMTVCGVLIVGGLLATKGWHWLASRRKSTKRILRDPQRRISEAKELAYIRRAGL